MSNSSPSCIVQDILIAQMLIDDVNLSDLDTGLREEGSQIIWALVGTGEEEEHLALALASLLN